MVFNVNRQEGEIFPCDRVLIIGGAQKGRRGIVGGTYDGPTDDHGGIGSPKLQRYWVCTDPIGKKNKRTWQVVLGVDMVAL